MIWLIIYAIGMILWVGYAEYLEDSGMVPLCIMWPVVIIILIVADLPYFIGERIKRHLSHKRRSKK